MSEEQRIINELLAELDKIKATAYYYGSCGSSECDVIESITIKILDKYKQYKVGR